MPDIKIICEKCGCDRFTASSESVSSETVSAIECRVCKHQANVNELVTFREIPYFMPKPELQMTKV